MKVTELLTNEYVLRLILLMSSDNYSLEKTSNTPIEELEESLLDCIAYNPNGRKRVAFFCPTSSFQANFGTIPHELEKMGCEVIWFFGTVTSYLESREKNKWLIINDMIRRVRGIDAIVTASVMDCLPDSCIHVLHDHLSFAHFDLEEHIKKLMCFELLEQERLETKRDVFNKISAFVVFLAYYDLVLTSGPNVTDLTRKALSLMGYLDTKQQTFVCSPLNYSYFDHIVDVTRFKNEILVLESGYAKLDIPVKVFSKIKPEKLIVYAPTPHDFTGNKETALWNNAFTLKNFGVPLLETLCRTFCDHTIVFKPYKDESPELLQEVQSINQRHENLVIDYCGSNYWPLYSKTSILISDFSSTAYTFALGLGRPVVFFSPNEPDLPQAVRDNNYCKYRHYIGKVSTSVDSVVSSIQHILSNYDNYLTSVQAFKNKFLVNPGRAGVVAAHAIMRRISGLPIEYSQSSVFVSKKGKTSD